ncbi:MAG: hypothetical protein QME81_18985, partial [bacterium]|nr:hypothetical protein [bacterium]
PKAVQSPRCSQRFPELCSKSLQETVIEENGKRLAIRSQCLGTCGKVFQAVGVAIPPTIREI